MGGRLPDRLELILPKVPVSISIPCCKTTRKVDPVRVKPYRLALRSAVRLDPRIRVTEIRLRSIANYSVKKKHESRMLHFRPPLLGGDSVCGRQYLRATLTLSDYGEFGSALVI